jgi:activator of HSP90 ATPase
MHKESSGPTRRHFAGSLALALGGLAVTSTLHSETPQTMQQLPPSTPGDPRTALHQEIDLPSSPSRIETALLDAKQFAAFTGLPATIDPHEGGAFSIFQGMIVGRTIEIVSGQRIVQAWRPADWKPGVYSVVKFEFKSAASGATVILDHTGFPAGDYDHLSAGWHEHYWDPLKKFLA